MAIYNDPNVLIQQKHEDFDLKCAPGTPTPRSGIYRCISCGYEAVSTEGHALPPENPAHIVHAGFRDVVREQMKGREAAVVKAGRASEPHEVLWQLVVASEGATQA